MGKARILYVEDMEKCHKLTQEALGDEYNLDWMKTSLEVLDALYTKGKIERYDAAILDVNLSYEPSKPNEEQSKEGLELIKIIREEAKKRGINLPILCVSSQNDKEEAIEKGADLFIFKKEFWKGEGKETLDSFLKDK